MKILMFGTTGQVARSVLEIVPADVSLRSVARDEADFLQPEACLAVLDAWKPDVIINAYMPGQIARWASGRGVPFLHVSTDYVFDGSGTAPWGVAAPTNPVNAYGRTKLAGEEAVRAADGPHAILRTSWVFSRHGSNFVRTMLRLGATRDQLNVVADQHGGPTPAPAIAGALLTMAQNLVRQSGPGGTFHFSGAPDVTWAGFATEIFAQAQMAVRVNPIASAEYPTPARRPYNSRLDCTALEDAHGIIRPDWRAALRPIIQDTLETHHD